MNKRGDDGARRFIRRLSLHSFRNYTTLDLYPNPCGLILAGPNGAGKTNILEAVSLLTPGRGLRRATATDFPNKDNPDAGWHVFADMDFCGERHRLGLGQEGEQNSVSSTGAEAKFTKISARRQARLDGKPAQGRQRARIAASIWLTPAQDRLFSGGASERRRFFDRFAFAHDARHGEHALDYEKSMRQRQAALEEGHAPPAWLDGLEQTMAQAGAALAFKRARLVQALQTTINQGMDSAFPGATLSVKGFLEEKAEQGMETDELSALFAQSLRDNRAQDNKARGRPFDGPHRADILVRHQDKDMPAALCSTGEQKALLTGLVLAQTRALAAHLKAPPFLLLDEACAHLDSVRRTALAEEISTLGAQVWMTGTDISLFSAFEKKIEIFTVENGNIARIKT